MSETITLKHVVMYPFFGTTCFISVCSAETIAASCCIYTSEIFYQRPNTEGLTEPAGASSTGSFQRLGLE
jgi:hypothetical protein